MNLGNFKERTTDIYEQVEGYPKPPLVPLPDKDDYSSVEKDGLVLNSKSEKILRAFGTLSGFRRYHQVFENNLEEILRKTNTRGPGLFAPVISASLAMDPDPRPLSPYERAATLLFAAQELYQEIITAKFPPDTYKGQALEMGQYPNLFATNIVVDRAGGRLFKSNNNQYIIVIVNNRFYALEIWNPSQPLSINETIELLQSIAASAREESIGDESLTPAIITSVSDRTQAKLFSQIRGHRINEQSLEIMKHTFLVLCLDLDSTPANAQEIAQFSHIGNLNNRWWHSSLQLVVFGNSQAAAIGSFSAYIDGNVMMRGISEIQQRALRIMLDPDASYNHHNYDPTYEVKWNILPKWESTARKDLEQILDHQSSSFTIDGIGRKSFISKNLEPVPAFILALQMTANTFSQQSPLITQFFTLSRYRCMDLDTTFVTTEEVKQFTKEMLSLDKNKRNALRLIAPAIRSQIEAIRKGRKELSQMTILGYYMNSRSRLGKFYVNVVLMFTIFLLRKLNLLFPRPREIVVSHPEIYPGIPVVGRPGVRLPYAQLFGLHYQIFPDSIVITMMPGIHWQVSNKDLVVELESNLNKILGLFEG